MHAPTSGGPQPCVTHCSEKSSPPAGDSGDSGAAAGGAGGSFISHAAQFVASAGLNRVQRGQLRSAMDAHRLYGRKIKFQQQLEMRATAATELHGDGWMLATEVYKEHPSIRRDDAVATSRLSLRAKMAGLLVSYSR